AEPKSLGAELVTVGGKKSTSSGLSAGRGRIACRQFVRLIAKYLDGELSTSQHRSMERHRTDCPICSRYLEGYREMVAAVRSLKDPVCEPAKVPEHLVGAILTKIGR